MKRILVVKGNGLLSAGIEYLLNGEVDLSIQSLSIENCAHLESELVNFNPDVIVLDERIYLSGYCELMKLIAAYPHLPFIVVSADNNLIHIYTPHAFSLTRASDFANVVRYI